MPDSRTGERTPVQYTMKTPHTTARHSPGPRPTHARTHSRSSSTTKRSGKSSKPSTPIASPRMPYSVGQAYPPAPKLSPGLLPGGRSPSPNYFGLIPDHSVDPRESSLLPRDNWSSPTSSVRSFAAALPKQVSIEANPDYEAFKKQADMNRAETFNLSSSYFSPPTSSNPAMVRPRPPPRWHTHASDHFTEQSTSRPTKDRQTSRMDIDQDSLHDSAYVSSDSKRNSEASMLPPPTLNMPRFESPQQVESPFERRTTLSKVEDRHPRLSITQNKLDPPSPKPFQLNKPRAETEPSTSAESGPSLMTPAQLKTLLESPDSDTDLLLLDVRVSQQYQHERIEGALNLCTPTTLLKRATFNLQKLQQTFQNPEDKERFSKWASTKNLVVYDSQSAEKRDAVTCLNMLKKFSNEGYKGNMYVLRGGFNAFSDAHPEFVDDGAATGSGGSQLLSSNQDSGRSGIPPVIGGVMLPQGGSGSNPFFSNIRQNMDLADGVGQLDISRPSALDSPALPQWIRHASKTKDHGKQVSDKFLHIEQDERTRMNQAFSMINPAINTTGRVQVQLCGVEKGGKNRYKDILPFEHARVKLQGRAAGACDYVNASHIKASRSNKRYIASQGPLPATFEDFWSVIWDHDVRVIVMLTAESEGGTLKCHPYWKDREFGPIRLKLLSEKKVSLDIDKHRSSSQASGMDSSYSSSSASELGRRRANTLTSLEGSTPTAQPPPSQGESPYVIIRKFAMSHGSYPFAPIREVTHLHYPSWPDFGAPAQPAHLLALVELANVMQRAALPIDTPSITSPDTLPMAWYDEPEADTRARPMLVHCSAGCGRTGTFCTVDSVIDMMKRQRLAKTVLKPVKKRDSDGDIKMSGEREVEEPISPQSAQEKAFSFSKSANNGSRRTSTEARRKSWEYTPPLDVSWVGDESVDLINKTVEEFRTQRLSMVQSLRQFVLCYETVLEYLARLHERNSVTFAPPGGRARSGSLQVRRESERLVHDPKGM